jgi:spermidine synthase
MWIAGLSGLCSMIYEVVWLRLLIPVLSSSTYSFTLVLASFISGITLGSYVIYKYSDRIKNPLKLLGLLQLAIAITIIITLPLYERLPYTIWSAIGDPEIDSHGYSYYLFVQFFYVFLIMILPTVFMGMTLPLAGRIAVKEIEKSGSQIGSVFAINTLGNVIGSLLAGLFLIPIIGIRTTILIALLINLILGFTILFKKDVFIPRIKWVYFGISIISFAFFITRMNSNSWAYSLMLSEVPRKINRKIPPDSYQEFVDLSKNHEKILFYKEGIGGTTVVAKNKKEVYLFTNGKGDANSVGDYRTQVSLGQTPVILHPKADSVFVIGFGAGTTIGNVMSHPNVKYGEVAEISSEVIDASIHFNHINQNPLSKKNLKVIRDDGVSALRLSPRKYDIIISQPSNPWSAGVGNLFTKEFFNDCKEKLRPGGFVAQWFSLYEMDDKSLKLIIRTALSEFKHLSLWHIGTNDILLMCSEKPFDFNLEKIQENYNLGSDQLKSINIHCFSSFLSQQIVSSEKGVIDYAGTGQLNTEDQPLLELWAPRAYYYNSTPTEFSKIDERKHFLQSDLLLNKYMDKHNLTKDEILQTGLFQSLGGNKELAFYLADLNPDIYLAWSKKAMDAGDKIKALEYLELASKNVKTKNNSSLHKEKAIILGKSGDFAKALAEINIAISDEPGRAELHYQKGTFHMSLNEFEKAIPALEKAIELDPYMIDAYNNLATIRGKQKNYKAVITILDKAIIISSNNPKVYFNRAYAKGFLNDFPGAVMDFSKVIELDPKNGQAYVLRGRAYIAMGKKQEACSDFAKAKSMGVPGANESLNQFCQ